MNASQEIFSVLFIVPDFIMNSLVENAKNAGDGKYQWR